ncbi:L-seryl-tRNA(Sec) kinase [Candidatus Bilamarchaeum dharawalense]|uniref:L-seryl-tRNA(Sec) kinase n=1 Tax=Candidatus Bilamarchaeum dharawalense TaxID=2885759 RepID=A0A5E4LRV1_9ARCH|nr:L-seryl-tRNA(Sec) kinase [Candidatus Bilamarchaeum dharawalense]
MLIIICGLPGSGKTTAAKMISKHYSAVHLSSDIIRKQNLQKPQYSDEEKEKVYTEMAEQVEKNLKNGKNVVADATFYKAKQRDRFLALAEKAGTKGFVVICSLPESEIRKRIGKREKGPSDADFEVYLKLKKEFEPIAGRYLEINVWGKHNILEKISEFIGE